MSISSSPNTSHTIPPFHHRVDIFLKYNFSMHTHSRKSPIIRDFDIPRPQSCSVLRHLLPCILPLDRRRRLDLRCHCLMCQILRLVRPGRKSSAVHRDESVVLLPRESFLATAFVNHSWLAQKPDINSRHKGGWE